MEAAPRVPRGGGPEGLGGMMAAMRTASQPLPPYPHLPPVRTLSCAPALGIARPPSCGGAYALEGPALGGVPDSEGLALHRGRAQLDDMMW